MKSENEKWLQHLAVLEASSSMPKNKINVYLQIHSKTSSVNKNTHQQFFYFIFPIFCVCSSHVYPVYAI